MTDRRVAMITGAGSGIGRATAALLASDGYAVAAADLSEEMAAETISRLRADGLALAVDVADPAQVRAAVEQTVVRFGRVDVLVTCAGHLELVPLSDLTPEVLRRMLSVHLEGTIFAVQACAQTMAASGYGRIVCISSLAARKPVITHGHYAAAKAGIVGFARTASAELGPSGITINCILPGAIETPMLAILGDDERAAMANNPVGRIGTPDDIAHAVRFLASPEAGFITGATLLVTGGAYT